MSAVPVAAPDPEEVAHPLDITLEEAREFSIEDLRDELLTVEFEAETTDSARELLKRRVATQKADLAERAARSFGMPEFEGEDAKYTLTSILKSPTITENWLIQELMLEESRVLLAAEAKAGKTTMVMNLVRSLKDGSDFLEHFKVNPLPAGDRIAVLDGEMTPAKLKTWYARLDMDDSATDDVVVYPLGSDPNGMVMMDLLNETTAQKWVEYLTRWNVKALILDPVVVFLGASGLAENSNDEVNRWMVSLDSICARAGVKLRVVVHHTGHDGSRARGASKFIGWGDTNLTYEVNPTDDTRWLSCKGRDVGFGKTQVVMDDDKITLSFMPTTVILPPTPTTAVTKHIEDERRVLEAVKAHTDDTPEGGKTDDIRATAGRNKQKVVKILEKLQSESKVEAHEVPARGGMIRYFKITAAGLAVDTSLAGTSMSKVAAAASAVIHDAKTGVDVDTRTGVVAD